MNCRDDIFKIETRQEIYNFISNHPGLHLREISRKLNIPVSTLAYHLRYLKKKELIVVKNNQRYARYFVKERISMRDKEIFDLLRQDVPRRIILSLLSPVQGEEYKDRPAVRKKLRNSKHELQMFSKNEILDVTKYWIVPCTKLFSLHKHPTTLDYHLKKLVEADLIEKIKVGKEIKYKLKDSDDIVTFFIVYHSELSDESINIWLSWLKLLSPNNVDRIMEFTFNILPHPYYA